MGNLEKQKGVENVISQKPLIQNLWNSYFVIEI